MLVDLLAISSITRFGLVHILLSRFRLGDGRQITFKSLENSMCDEKCAQIHAALNRWLSIRNNCNKTIILILKGNLFDLIA